MKLFVLPDREYWALRAPLDALLPDGAADEAFWSSIHVAWQALEAHLSRFGDENTTWEQPDYPSACRVLYVYLHAESIYTPELLPPIAALLPRDGQQWCAELECYSDAEREPNGIPMLLGFLVLTADGAFVREQDARLISYADRLGLSVA